ncbi:MAG: MBOAT family O-acyltransferase [Coriobacteriia bacterium]|nr:MBOAT family O-acyltransferase [Coriobacteriia bacterium]
MERHVGHRHGGGEMIFGEWVYVVFLIGAAAVFRFLPGRARPWWLAACGLAFYAYYSPAFVWLLAVELAVVFALVRGVRRSALAFGGALAVTIGVLVAYKYGALLSSTLASAATVLRAGRLPSFPQLALPLAISFFTFEFVHYVVDARKGTLPEHRLEDFLAFMLFFPTMVAGPIKRFQDFQPQLTTARASAEDINAGITRIVVGLAKKVVIADTIAPLTTPLLSNTGVGEASAAQLLVALLAFAVKIYMDFSGYSDIAIGSARLFGIHVPENFAWPYLRRNVAEFWRHWHMSLTSWITDYVYKPLGGNRRGLALTALNVVIAMAVSGLWHGAQWHFVAWGLYHGVLLALFRLWERGLKPLLLTRLPVLREGRVARAVGRAGALTGGAATFALVTLGWGLFVMPVGRFIELLGRLL